MLWPRPVKNAAEKWEMQDVMWVFSGAADADVKADTEMLLALRTELSDHLKIMDRVLCFSGGTEEFNKIGAKLKGLVVAAKERVR